MNSGLLRVVLPFNKVALPPDTLYGFTSRRALPTGLRMGQPSGGGWED